MNFIFTLFSTCWIDIYILSLQLHILCICITSDICLVSLQMVGIYVYVFGLINRIYMYTKLFIEVAFFKYIFKFLMLHYSCYAGTWIWLSPWQSFWKQRATCHEMVQSLAKQLSLSIFSFTFSSLFPLWFLFTFMDYKQTRIYKQAKAIQFCNRWWSWFCPYWRGEKSIIDKWWGSNIHFIHHQETYKLCYSTFFLTFIIRLVRMLHDIL